MEPDRTVLLRETTPIHHGQWLNYLLITTVEIYVILCKHATHLHTNSNVEYIIGSISLAWLDLPPRLCAVVGGGARLQRHVFLVGVSKVCGSGRGSSHTRLWVHLCIIYINIVVASNLVYTKTFLVKGVSSSKVSYTNIASRQNGATGSGKAGNGKRDGNRNGKWE